MRNAVEDLKALAERLHEAGHDLTRFMRIIGSLSADWVEMRHTPPNPELDGYRSRDDFVAYLMREAEFFPRTFESIAVAASPRVVADHVAIDPLSFSGRLAGSDREVDIRYVITLHLNEAGRVAKITGALTSNNRRDDVIAWLKVIERLGGLGQTLALAHRPAA